MSGQEPSISRAKSFNSSASSTLSSDSLLAAKLSTVHAAQASASLLHMELQQVPNFDETKGSATAPNYEPVVKSLLSIAREQQLTTAGERDPVVSNARASGFRLPSRVPSISSSVSPLSSLPAANVLGAGASPSSFNSLSSRHSSGRTVVASASAASEFTPNGGLTSSDTTQLAPSLSHAQDPSVQSESVADAWLRDGIADDEQFADAPEGADDVDAPRKQVHMMNSSYETDPPLSCQNAHMVTIGSLPRNRQVATPIQATAPRHSAPIRVSAYETLLQNFHTRSPPKASDNPKSQSGITKHVCAHGSHSVPDALAPANPERKRDGDSHTDVRADEKSSQLPTQSPVQDSNPQPGAFRETRFVEPHPRTQETQPSKTVHSHRVRASSAIEPVRPQWSDRGCPGDPMGVGHRAGSMQSAHGGFSHLSESGEGFESVKRVCSEVSRPQGLRSNEMSGLMCKRGRRTSNKRSRTTIGVEREHSGLGDAQLGFADANETSAIAARGLNGAESMRCHPLEPFGVNDATDTFVLYTNSVRAELLDLARIRRRLFPVRNPATAARKLGFWWIVFARYVNAVFDVIEIHLVPAAQRSLRSAQQICETTLGTVQNSFIPGLLTEIESSRDLLAAVDHQLLRVRRIRGPMVTPMLQNLGQSNRTQQSSKNTAPPSQVPSELRDGLVALKSLLAAIDDAVPHLQSLLHVVDSQLAPLFAVSPLSDVDTEILHGQCAQTLCSESSGMAQYGIGSLAILHRWLPNKRVEARYVRPVARSCGRITYARAVWAMERAHFGHVPRDRTRTDH